MNADILKTILTEHRDCLSNLQRLKSLLMDLIPEEKMMRNLLVLSVEERIYDEIKETEYVDVFKANSLKNRLISASGCSSEKAEEIVLLWLNALTKEYDYKFLSRFEFIEPLEEGKTYIKSEIDLLERVIVSGEVKSIGEYFFSGSENLKEVIILNGVEEICDCAFKDCIGIEKVIFPNSMRSLGEAAFEGCVNLEEVIFNDDLTTIGDNCFYDCKKIKTIIMGDNVKKIGDSAFSGCSSLERIKISPKVKEIGSHEFCECVNLCEIELPEGIKCIKDYSFAGCMALTDFIIPNTVESIGDCAFIGCENLENIVIPKEAIDIGDSVFDRTKWYENAIRDNDYYEINGTLLYVNEDIKELDFLKDIRVIGSGVFSQCKNISTITIPSNVKEIRASFCGCESLRSVSISENVHIIGEFAFAYCTNLNKVEMAEGVLEIDECAFEQCGSLESISFPQSLLKIDKEAFSNCNNLENIDFSNSNIIVVGDGLLNNIEPDEKALYINIEAFKDCTRIVEDKRYQFLFSISQGYENSLITGIISNDMFSGRSDIYKINIPDDVFIIGERAFKECQNLETVIVSDSTRWIKEYAFDMCKSLESVKLPSELSEIEQGTFRLCVKIKEIVIPDSVRYIRWKAFIGCEKLEKVVLGKNLSFVEKRAFSGCKSLKNVIFPDKEIIITDSSFSGYEDKNENYLYISSSAFDGTSYYFDANNIFYKNDPNWTIPISKLGLSNRTQNALRKYGCISSVDELRNKTLDEIKSIVGIGEKSLKELIDCMSEYNISFSNDDILFKSIAWLDLSVRSYNKCVHKGINTVGELLKMSNEEYLSVFTFSLDKNSSRGHCRIDNAEIVLDNLWLDYGVDKSLLQSKYNCINEKKREQCPQIRLEEIIEDERILNKKVKAIFKMYHIESVGDLVTMSTLDFFRCTGRTNGKRMIESIIEAGINKILLQSKLTRIDCNSLN